VLPLQAAPSSVEASKKDGTLKRPATDRARGGGALKSDSRQWPGVGGKVGEHPHAASGDVAERIDPVGTHHDRVGRERADVFDKPRQESRDPYLPSFFTDEAMLRLEEGLRAQRAQREGRHLSEPDAVSSRSGSLRGSQTEEHLWNDVGEVRRTITQRGAHGNVVQIVDPAEQTFRDRDPVARYAGDVALERRSGTTREGDPPFELRGWQDSRPSVENLHRVGPSLKLPDETGSRRSAFWPWLKVDLLLFLMLLVVGTATLGVSLKARTEASTEAAPVNIKTDSRTASVSPNNGEPRQPATNAVNSPTAKASLPPPSPAPPNKQPVEAQGPATPSLPPPPSPAPPNEQPVKAQGPATSSLPTPPSPNKQSVEAQEPATPWLPPPSPAPHKKQQIEARGPATPAASETPAASPQCNIPVCQQFYRSFRRSDCTYQPLTGGPRRICER